MGTGLLGGAGGGLGIFGQKFSIHENSAAILVAVGHIHRLIGDIFFGSTVEPVRHRVKIPVLVVRAD